MSSSVRVSTAVRAHILKAFYFVTQVSGHTLKYDNINALRERMSEISPNLNRYGDVEDANYFKQAQSLAQVMVLLLFDEVNKLMCFNQTYINCYCLLDRTVLNSVTC